MDFETREQYVAWRTEWIANYLDLSKMIRAAKVANVEADKAGISKTSINHLKADASQALEQRHLSKERAGEFMRLKRLQKVT